MSLQSLTLTVASLVAVVLVATGATSAVANLSVLV